MKVRVYYNTFRGALLFDIELRIWVAGCIFKTNKSFCTCILIENKDTLAIMANQCN
jgi:hypothetical protein